MSEQDFQNAVSTLHEAIPSLTDNEIIIEFSKIIAMIGDSHTTLHPIYPLLAPTEIGPYINPERLFRTYPIRAYWFNDDLFVIGSTKEYREA